MIRSFLLVTFLSAAIFLRELKTCARAWTSARGRT